MLTIVGVLTIAFIGMLIRNIARCVDERVRRCVERVCGYLPQMEGHRLTQENSLVIAAATITAITATTTATTLTTTGMMIWMLRCPIVRGK